MQGVTEICCNWWLYHSMSQRLLPWQVEPAVFQARSVIEALQINR